MVQSSNEVLCWDQLPFHCRLQVVSVMLACRRIQGSHTGEVIYQYFDEVIFSFGLWRKIEFVITDNASNMKKAIKLFDNDNVGESPQEGTDSIEPVEIIFEQESIIQLSRISCFCSLYDFRNTEAVTRIFFEVWL